LLQKQFFIFSLYTLLTFDDPCPKSS